MKKLNKDIQNTLNNMANRGEDLNREVKQKTKEGYQESNDTLDEVKNYVEDTFNHIKDSTTHLYEDSKKKMDNAKENIEEYYDELRELIKDNPLSSLVISGGMGYLFSLLLEK